MRNYSPVSEMRKGRRRVVARNSRSKANMAKHRVKTFAPFIALAPLIAVINNVVKWDAYDMENTTGKARRCGIHSKNKN